MEKSLRWATSDGLRQVFHVATCRWPSLTPFRKSSTWLNFCDNRQATERFSWNHEYIFGRFVRQTSPTVLSRENAVLRTTNYTPSTQIRIWIWESCRAKPKLLWMVWRHRNMSLCRSTSLVAAIFILWIGLKSQCKSNILLDFTVTQTWTLWP